MGKTLSVFKHFKTVGPQQPTICEPIARDVDKI